MTLRPLTTDTTAPRPLDTARVALGTWLAARGERAQRRNEARAVRAHRLAVARFGEYPTGRAATALHHGGWGA